MTFKCIYHLLKLHSITAWLYTGNTLEHVKPASHHVKFFLDGDTILWRFCCVTWACYSDQAMIFGSIFCNRGNGVRTSQDGAPIRHGVTYRHVLCSQRSMWPLCVVTDPITDWTITALSLVLKWHKSCWKLNFLQNIECYCFICNVYVPNLYLLMFLKRGSRLIFLIRLLTDLFIYLF